MYNIILYSSDQFIVSEYEHEFPDILYIVEINLSISEENYVIGIIHKLMRKLFLSGSDCWCI